MKVHGRNCAAHEFEADFEEAGGPMIFVGNRESAAVGRTAELLVERGEDQSRLYHTYPSPGPVRRYVGTVSVDGTLRRA